jgi:RecA-family ATPase
MADLYSLARALGGEVSKGQVLCPGPGHSATDRSLSVRPDAKAPDGFVCHSFAGDDPIVCKDYVREKAGLPAFAPTKSNGGKRFAFTKKSAAPRAQVKEEVAPAPKDRIVATYDYTNDKGELLYQVIRLEPKSFRQRRPDGNGGWIWSVKGCRRVLYRLADLLEHPDATVFVTEGEKDAERVASLGHCATTVACGDWTKDCIDADKPGVKKARKAATLLHGTAKTIRIVRLPGLEHTAEHHGKDVSDWLDADASNADKLVEVCFAAPLWTPEVDAAEGDEERPPPLVFIDMSRWDDEPVPEQDWTVHNRIPNQQCVLFSGQGGAGKSTVQLQQSVAHVLARDWLGTMPKHGRSLFVDAEDPEDVIHRRLAAIARHYDVKFADLIKDGLHLISLFGKDAVMATVARNGKVEPTPLYDQLYEAAGDIKPVSIGIAASANVFAGDEVDRSQVQQFVALLSRLAVVANGSVSLISHPSLSGIVSDSGVSGSTQWHNSVRARSYMKGLKPEDGEEPDNDLRELVFKKNNYGPLSETIVLRYQNGLFLPVTTNSLDRRAKEDKADEIFLELLDRFTKSNRSISDKKSRSYAPAMFAREAEAKNIGLSSKAFEAAMRRLFAANMIWNEDIGRPSRPQYRIALKPDNDTPTPPSLRICASCGKEFEATSSKTKFCSDACRQKSYRG